MSKQDEKSAKAIKLVLKHYLDQCRLNWRVSVPAMLLPGIGNILVFYLPPLFLAKIVSLYGKAATPSFAQLLPYFCALGGAWFGGEIIWRVAMHFQNRMVTRGIKTLYINALEKILAKDLSFFSDNFAGALTKKIISYAKSYESVMDTVSMSIFSNLIPLIFIVIVLWSFSAWLVFVLLGLISLTIALVLPLIRHRQQLVNIREAAGNEVAGHIADSIGNMLAVQSFARATQEQNRHKKQTADYMKKMLRSWDYGNLRIDVLTSPLYVLINLVGLATALAVSKGGSQSIQVIIVTFTYYAAFTRVLWEFNRIYRQLETYITDAAQFTQLLLEEPAIKDLPGAVELRASEAKIEFKNVSFTFKENKAASLFKNFNLQISPGEKVGLVGRSGGGKTTITKLLLRFMDINSGDVLINGHDIQSVTLDSLRSSIAYVPQEPVMFHRSLLENIQYGDLSADHNSVVSAAKKAHAHEFIIKLPHGYDTLVGERGTKLSGGQRQRVAIARAILKDAPILVLDEATSSLDSESETLIQEALRELMKDKTAIVIAHRLSTIQKMDRIVVLDNGEIIEEGSHTTLLQNNGLYAKLWSHQSGGFIEE